MNKQTAIEWLKDWMGKNQYFIGNDLLKAIEQAKAMEKEQIIEAHGLKRVHHVQQGVDYWVSTCGLEYYDNTYGGDHIGDVNEMINP